MDRETGFRTLLSTRWFQCIKNPAFTQLLCCVISKSLFSTTMNKLPTGGFSIRTVLVWICAFCVIFTETVSVELHSSSTRIPLDTWSLYNINKSISLSVQTPGVVHLHLLKSGLIHDPYYRFNELEYRWICSETWTFESSFILDKKPAAESRVVFEGLDGVATIYLNDIKLGKAENMFLVYEFDITTRALEGTNRLVVVFHPVLDYTAEKAAAYPYEVPATINHNTWSEITHRPFLRKAGSDFGWDWGPAFIPVGIWKPAYIHTNPKVEIESFLLKQYHKRTPSGVSVRLCVSPLFSKSPKEGVVTVFFDTDEVGSAEVGSNKMQSKFLNGQTSEISFVVHNATLWWPRGHGPASTHNLTLLYRSMEGWTSVLHQNVGLRSVQLIQNNSFYFRVNDVPIFAKGANVAPLDAFHTRVTDKNLEQLLTSAIAANMNMVRVWGGGIYPTDSFFEISLSLGLLVWQEMMFACSMYPRDELFLANSRKEIQQQMRRLQKHTSIVIWGGNNENEAIMDQFEAGYFMNHTFNRELYVADYAKLFVDVVAQQILCLDETRPFVDTSPTNGILSQDPYVKRWGNTSNASIGDLHYYNYSCDCEKAAESFPIARFISEFGFQSLPSITSLHNISLPKDWVPGSKFLNFRQRHQHGYEQINTQILRHFKPPPWLLLSTNLNVLSSSQMFSDYLYITQLQQGLCYEAAVHFWRKNKQLFEPLIVSERKGVSAGTMGVLYWQLNDIWQGPSWSGLEYDGNWKVLHYFARRFFSDVLLCTTTVQGKETLEVHIHGINDLTSTLKGVLNFSFVHLQNGSLYDAGQVNFSIRALASTKLHSVRMPEKYCTATTCIFQVSCPKCTTDNGNTVIYPSNAFFATYKDLELSASRIFISSIELQGPRRVSMDVRVYGGVCLFLNLHSNSLKGWFSDNNFIAIPGQRYRIHLTLFDETSLEDFVRHKARRDVVGRCLQHVYNVESTTAVERREIDGEIRAGISSLNTGSGGSPWYTMGMLAAGIFLLLRKYAVSSS